jgi:hypothetical protein
MARPVAQIEGAAMAEHAVRRRAEAAAVVVQDQTRSEAQRAASTLAGLNQHAFGRLSYRGP